MNWKCLSLMMVILSLCSTNPSYAVSGQSKHWSIDDFIKCKVYEIDNQKDQHRCVQVKLHLLNACKAELEQRDLERGETVRSISGAILGGVCGGLIGALRNWEEDDNTKLWAAIWSMGCAFIGYCTGPVYRMNVKRELREIAKGLAYYKKCLDDPDLVNCTPQEVLDSFEYNSHFSEMEMNQIKKEMIAQWAAETVAG